LHEQEFFAAIASLLNVGNSEAGERGLPTRLELRRETPPRDTFFLSLDFIKIPLTATTTVIVPR
jgi:hypothetical protein